MASYKHQAWISVVWRNQYGEPGVKEAVRNDVPCNNSYEDGDACAPRRDAEMRVQFRLDTLRETTTGLTDTYGYAGLVNGTSSSRECDGQLTNKQEINSYREYALDQPSLWCLGGRRRGYIPSRLSLTSGPY